MSLGELNTVLCNIAWVCGSRSKGYVRSTAQLPLRHSFQRIESAKALDRNRSENKEHEGTLREGKSLL
jgi:hypothetical protein